MDARSKIECQHYRLTRFVKTSLYE